MKYKVITQHFGDKQYWAGESREIVNEQDANELIKLGLIAPFDDDVADVSDATGKELIDKGYAEEVAESTTAAEPEIAEPEKPATGKKTASKATETNAE